MNPRLLGEEDPAPEVESPELVPDSSEEAGKQEPAARQAHQGSQVFLNAC